MVDPTFSIETEALAGILDGLDYYQILKVAQTASQTDIKDAYHRESRLYHPDKIFQEPDEVLKERVTKIFKRVTEAYFVLRDDRKRNKYTSDVNGEYRLLKLRYDEQAEQEVRKTKEMELGTTPNGRKFYGAGVADMQAGRFDSAERNLKMAVMYEPQNILFKEKLAEAQKAIKPKGFTVGK